LFKADAILSGRRKRFGRRSKIGARQNVHKSNTRGKGGFRDGKRAHMQDYPRKNNSIAKQNMSTERGLGRALS
jgi:hypothetical protein